MTFNQKLPSIEEFSRIAYAKDRLVNRKLKTQHSFSSMIQSHVPTHTMQYARTQKQKKRTKIVYVCVCINVQNAQDSFEKLSESSYKSGQGVGESVNQSSDYEMRRREARGEGLSRRLYIPVWRKNLAVIALSLFCSLIRAFVFLFSIFIREFDSMFEEFSAPFCPNHLFWFDEQIMLFFFCFIYNFACLSRCACLIQAFIGFYSASYS